MGICTGTWNWYREMVAIELSEPLQVGVPVCLSFKAAVGGFGSWSINSAVYTAPGIGLKFFNQPPTVNQLYVPPNSAALHLSTVPTDTSIWYDLSGTYVPDSNYTHLVVGSFFGDWENTMQVLDSTGYGTFPYSYMFIDDVRVSFELQYCDDVDGLKDRESAHEARAFPMPFADELTVTFDKPLTGVVRWALSDAQGRMVQDGTSAQGTAWLKLMTGELPGGAYLLRFYDDMGAWAPLRLLKT